MGVLGVIQTQSQGLQDLKGVLSLHLRLRENWLPSFKFGRDLRFGLFLSIFGGGIVLIFPTLL